MGVASHESESRRDYIPGLDGIRALAIIAVLFGHSVIYDEFTALSPVGLAAGYMGVTIFFVLSGYLITSLLLREEARNGTISLRHFYMRRALRLFPALWLFLLVLAILRILGQLPDHPWHSFAASILYVRNLVGRGHETNHLWSLSIEEQFYLVWPLILIASPQRNLVRLAIAVAAIFSVTYWRWYAATHELVAVGTLYVRSDFRFDAPMFGCALALVRQITPQDVPHIVSSKRARTLLLIVAAVGLSLWTIGNRGERAFAGSQSAMVCLMSVLLILSQLGADSPCRRLLCSNTLVTIGRLSYGLYLWQQLFLGPLTPELQSVRRFPIGLIATVAVATVSYYALELPLLRFKDRYYHDANRCREAGNSQTSLLLQESET